MEITRKTKINLRGGGGGNSQKTALANQRKIWEFNI
jgi:hypothetical protein